MHCVCHPPQGLTVTWQPVLSSQGSSKQTASLTHIRAQHLHLIMAAVGASLLTQLPTGFSPGDHHHLYCRWLGLLQGAVALLSSRLHSIYPQMTAYQCSWKATCPKHSGSTRCEYFSAVDVPVFSHSHPVTWGTPMYCWSCHQLQLQLPISTTCLA